ncbi:large-conductance mechanosensitive channel protein MscL [Allohahella marinimesophila]|uniref:Large-conductance mechanosensitive channel n=2 Tax=Allohahella marinimesophila TaxID=1054972 RepID=A0ABP7PVG8_9GAMM
MKEFKAFAMRGNVVDLAIGIIIGAAFGKIVASFVADIIMPPIGILVGGVDFSDLAFTLLAASEGADAVVIRYGLFVQTIINFLIVAFAVFMLVKALNNMKKKEVETEKKPVEKSNQERLLEEIRDALKAGNEPTQRSDQP